MRLTAGETRIEVSFWFVAVPAILLNVTPGLDPLICFCFCILHEIGHLAMMYAFGCAPEKIEFGYFGMRIDEGAAMLKTSHEVLTAAAGPAVSLILAAALYLYGFRYAAVVNAALGLFNLLPVPMLDMGRIITALTGGGVVLRRVGTAVCLILTAVGIALAVHSRRNFTLLAVSLYLLSGTLRGRE